MLFFIYTEVFKVKDEMNKPNDELIVGRNAVSEALRSERAINTLLVQKGERNGSVGRLIAMCREKQIVIKEVDKRKLDFLFFEIVKEHFEIAAVAVKIVKMHYIRLNLIEL